MRQRGEHDEGRRQPSEPRQADELPSTEFPTHDSLDRDTIHRHRHRHRRRAAQAAPPGEQERPHRH